MMFKAIIATCVAHTVLASGPFGYWKSLGFENEEEYQRLRNGELCYNQQGTGYVTHLAAEVPQSAQPTLAPRNPKYEEKEPELPQAKQSPPTFDRITDADWEAFKKYKQALPSARRAGPGWSPTSQDSQMNLLSKPQASSKRRSQTKRDSSKINERPGTPPKRQHQYKAKGSVGAGQQAPGLWFVGKGFVKVKLFGEAKMTRFPVRFEWTTGENTLHIHPRQFAKGFIANFAKDLKLDITPELGVEYKKAKLPHNVTETYGIKSIMYLITKPELVKENMIRRRLLREAVRASA